MKNRKNDKLIKKNLELAKKIAGEGIVLLKNEDNILPLDPVKPLAVFGRGCIDTKISGSGSGSTESNDTINIIDGLLKYDFNLDEELLKFYEGKVSTNKEDPLKNKFLENNKNNQDDNNELPWWYEYWGKYNPSSSEIEINDQLVKRASQKSEIALIVISRVSGGEECDRRLENDYYLSEKEKNLLNQVSRNFSNVVVLLNTAGVIDLSWIKEFPAVKGLLNISLPGQIAGTAVAEVLSGKMNPSGKLVDSYAGSYDDYSSGEHFSFNKEKLESIKTYQDYGLDPEENGSSNFDISPVTVYQEGIYTGYRYFDSFDIDLIYSFGFGLSYTEFDINFLAAKFDIEDFLISLKIMVNNKGNKYPGKEVIQIYVSKAEGSLEKPYQELVSYRKTDLLKPGQSQQLKINFSLRELAVYDEKSASYIIEEGYYYIRVGNSSRNTRIKAKIYAAETIVLEKLRNELELNKENQGKINFLSRKNVEPITYPEENEEMKTAPLITTLKNELIETKKKKQNKEIRQYIDDRVESIADSKVEDESHEQKMYQLQDVYNNKISLKEFVSQLSVKELAVLCNGYGNGQAFSGDQNAPKSIKYDDGSYIGSDSSNKQDEFLSLSPAIDRYGIPSLIYKDGPAGVGLTSWPVETMMASTWNDQLLFDFGDAVAKECEAENIDVWLGPALNLHRNPLAGRNFEYYSEDPLLTGRCAVAVTKGVMDNHKLTASAKHFVLNDQETYRRGNELDNIDAVDSIVQERVIREIYLKPFEMLVKNTEIMNIMTSFNKINGVFAAGNKELNINILRKEWGFRGYLVTDWGDMDIVVDGADAINAGNDVIMPGGPPVIEEVLTGYEEERVSILDLRRSAINLLNSVLKIKNF